MYWLYVVKLAARNMMRHRLRSSLTIAGIAVAMISFGLLRTVVDSWVAGAETGSAARLIVRNKASVGFTLPVALGERIRHVHGVEDVTWLVWFGGIYIDERNFFPQFGVDADTFFTVYPEMKVDPAELAAFKRDRRGAIVGKVVAAKYGWKVGDQIPFRGTIYPGNWSFVIRGIYEGVDEKVDQTQFIMHWDLINERVKALVPSMADRVGLFSVNARSPGDAAAVSAAVDENFRNSLDETRTESEKAFQLRFIAMIDTVLTAMQAIAYVVILIILAVMANTMAMAARERSREYATLKVLGFGDRFVVMLIMAESLTLSITGGALGIALTFPIADAFFNALRDMFRLFVVEPRTVVIQAVASVVIAILAAIVPALSSARVRIVDGLRSVT
jgi:putative ABC transport system permease protein